VTPTPWSREAVARVRAALEPARDPAKATPMARYMKDLFPFLGVSSPDRRALVRAALEGMPSPAQRDLDPAVRAFWRIDEREYQYAGCDLLSRHERRLDSTFLTTARWLITNKSWWDTVDVLASHVVGALVRRDTDLVPTMDEWIRSPDIWLARTALVHQMRWKAATDADRLFEYCLLRSGDTEFFIRKAIGWSLREYSKTDTPAVERFVERYEDRLSPLSRCEAMKWIERKRSG
jgi:3-methyladenine DNA glycosylase AlkD